MSRDHSERPKKGEPGYKSVAEQMRERRQKHLSQGIWSPTEMARISPLGLAVFSNQGRWSTPKHLRMLNRKLLDVAEGKTSRLLVELHPRSGKSELISHYFPAWYLGVFPERRVLLASYDSPFAANWSRQARQVLIDHGQQVFGLRATEHTGPADWWRLTGHRGYMVASGVGGSLTGKGGAIAIIDDPVKSAEDVRSTLMRDRLWEWYRSHLYPRLEKPGGAIVLVMSRWHEDDLAGRLLAEAQMGGEQWEELRIPAIAEDTDSDPLGREPGLAMWPDRFGLDDLTRIRRALGEYWFQALYQGRPSGQEGAQFLREQVRWYSVDGDSFVLTMANGETQRVPDSLCARFVAVDLALSEKQTADYTVSLACAVIPRIGIAVLDVMKDRVVPGTHVERIGRHMQEWDCPFALIEAVQFQADVVARARRSGLVAEKLMAKGDKVTRAQTAVKMWNGGQVFVPKNGSWVPGFLDEVCAFPVGSHDDQVDALAYACLEAAKTLQRNQRVLPIEMGRTSPWLGGAHPGVGAAPVLPRMVR